MSLVPWTTRDVLWMLALYKVFLHTYEVSMNIIVINEKLFKVYVKIKVIKLERIGQEIEPEVS